MKDGKPCLRKTAQRASSLALASIQRTKSEPTYVDEVVIGHHYLSRHPEDVSSIKEAKHIMTDGDSADGVYV